MHSILIILMYKYEQNIINLQCQNKGQLVPKMSFTTPNDSF